MVLIDWLKKWGLSSLKINAHFLEVEFEFNEKDKMAAWEMYVELLTRVATQKLSDESGVEKTALSSIHSLFGVTREILKKYGYESQQFAQIAIVILNQIFRPFTSKWHKLSEEGAFERTDYRTEFRNELSDIQSQILKYEKALREIIGIEEISKK